MAKIRYVSDLITSLGDKCVLGNDANTNREISIPEVNRVGLELTGFKKYVEPKRILILGNKEIAYINLLSKEEQIDRFQFLFTDETPCVIISRNHTIPDNLLEVAKEKDFPILMWQDTTSRLLLQLFSLLDDWFAPTTSVHGTLMQIYGKGVLIKGPSGIGKSEIALELLRKGHYLISDDYVELYRFDTRIIGRAPEVIRNMLEIRGVGILDVTKLFGYSSVSDEVEVEYVIELSKWDQNNNYERLGTNNNTIDILEVDIPHIKLPVSEGRSMSDVIEVSVTNFKLRETGIDFASEFQQRLANQLLKEDK